MTKFTFPARVDDTLAQDGVEFTVKDEFKQDWGTYKLRWMDRESARGKLVWQRAAKRYKSQIKAGSITPEELGRNILIENFLIDWSLPVEMTGGKKLAFSIEAAKELFSDEQTFWLSEKLAELAEDITNFGAVHDVEDNAVVPEKN